MPYKQVRLSETAYEWLDGHKDISDLKIVSIARHRSGEVTLNKDGTFTIRSGTIFHGKHTDLWLKVRERGNETLTEVIIIKMHLGRLPDPTKFEEKEGYFLLAFKYAWRHRFEEEFSTLCSAADQGSV